MGDEITLRGETNAGLSRLRELSEAAKGGDRAARGELRRAVRESAPGLIADMSDVARQRREEAVGTLAGKDPLIAEALARRYRDIARGVVGKDHTPLEALLSERVASSAFVVEYIDSLVSVVLGPRRPKGTSFSDMSKLLELRAKASRTYNADLKALAQIRKLQANAPVVQYNTQINVHQGRKGSV